MCEEILGRLVVAEVEAFSLWSLCDKAGSEVTMRRLFESQKAMQRTYALLEHVILELHDRIVIIPELVLCVAY